MSLSQVRQLLVKAATIQTTIEREARARTPNRLRLLRLQRIKLVLSERLHRLGRIAVPTHARPSLVPVIATSGSGHFSAKTGPSQAKL